MKLWRYGMLLELYSLKFMWSMSSISKNERNIQIPLFNVQHLKQNLEDLSGNLFEKDTLTENENSKILEKQLLLFLKYSMLS